MGECFDIRHSLRHLLQPQHFPDTTLQGEEIASIDLRRAIDLFQLSNSLTFELGNVTGHLLLCPSFYDHSRMGNAHLSYYLAA